MTSWPDLGVRGVPDSAPADVLGHLGEAALKPRRCLGLRDVQAIGEPAPPPSEPRLISGRDLSLLHAGFAGISCRTARLTPS